MISSLKKRKETKTTLETYIAEIENKKVIVQAA